MNNPGVPAGYIVFAHGSSIESANDSVRDAAAELARRGGLEIVEPAFLEGGRPDLRDAVDKLVARGVTRVAVVPYFLTLGLHLQRDLPKLVEQIRTAHPDLWIEVTAPVDGHPALLEALLGRAREAHAGRLDAEREESASEVD